MDNSDSLNPRSRNGVLIVPLVFDPVFAFDWAAKRRDAAAELVCEDLIAGRDPAWQLERWQAMKDYCRAAMEAM